MSMGSARRVSEAPFTRGIQGGLELDWALESAEGLRLY